ncbi:MAG: carbohydrate ABC transporter permease [Thermomicrobiales bacterium]|nr:carbohydrate ABC transporter permease [Thermomicrobiales bacterium]
MSSNYERTAGSRKRLDAWGIAGWVFLLLLLVFTVVPLAWMLSTALKTQLGALQFPPRWIPTNPTTENFRMLLDPNDDIGRRFLRYMLNSLWVSTATTVVGVLVAVPAAYAFSRFRFPGRNSLFYGVLLRNMFPAVIFLIPLFILMRNLRLVNSYGSLIITYLTFGLPLSIWLLKGFYDNIPVQLEQAARIDGASRFQAFIRIVMPLSAPGIVATAIYSFILAWNEYVYALTFITDDRKLTVPVGLQRFFSEYVANWPGLMAAAFLMSIPVVVMFLVLQKYFVRALTEGAIKQ